MKLDAGIIVAGRYEIETPIGSGGMSVVYRAYDKKLDRHVSLKVLKEDFLADTDLADRFPEEARAVASLHHPNIVSIFDSGQDGDILYIVLEYVDGASLKELISKRAPFDDDIILDAAIQIAEGLAEAHRNGIVHRDIKPQNILVTRTSVVKVADFGIARVAKSSTLTAGSGSMGSVHYSSPEQARNGYLDHKTDIYSLGVCMYEMATGRLPFDGETEVSVAMCHINNNFPDVLSYNPNLSESIVQIIAKATEKSASLRYQTAEDLIADLKQAQIDDSGNFVTAEVTATPYVPPPPPPDQKKVLREQRAKARTAFLNQENNFQDNEPVQDYGTPPVKSDKAAVWGGIFLGLIFVAILSVVGLLVVWPRITGGSNNNRVFPPNVVNRPLEEAETMAAERGLYIYVGDHAYSSIVPENHIIEQTPPPSYAGLVAGDRVTVTVSLGQEVAHLYTMPDITGIALADAEALLASLTVTHTIERQHDAIIPIDIVISQTPPANTQIGEGDSIVLLVSSGPDTGQVSVPDLTVLSETDALELLRVYMLIPYRRTVESATYAAGVIIEQVPAPGEIVDRESVVQFTVSTGPPAAEQPPPPAEEPPPPPPPAEQPPPPPPQEPPPATPPAEPEPNQPPEEEPDTGNLPDITIPPADGEGDPPPPPQPQTRSFAVPTWNVPEGVDMLHIQIMRQVEGGTATMYREMHVSPAQLPMQIEVTGTGTVTYIVFSVEDGGLSDIWRGDFEINFE